jgi:hypothetical protein
MRLIRLQSAVLVLGLLTMAGFVANFTTPVAFGQSSNTGTVVGMVEDQSGAVIQGATITLTDLSTKTVRKTATSHTGQYVFANIPPGEYSITASKSGFATDKVASQTVTVGTQTTANFRLQVGTEATTIEVKTSGADLQTINATIGSTVDPLSIEQLPSLLHDVGTFTALQAGVSPDGAVAGAVVDQSTFSLDGGNNSSDMDGSNNVYFSSFAGDPTGGISNQNAEVAASPTGVMPTPSDSVEEFKVNTNNQTADFNNSAGAQVEIVTKRGKDKWHATAYEYYLDNDFSANTWDNNLSQTPVPRYHYSKYGYAGGGPAINKNFLGGKTFIFANFQSWRYPQSETFERAVPSAALESGLITTGGTQYNMKTIDPRGIGIAPDVKTMWTTMMPPGNDTSCGNLASAKYCDGVNTIGFKSNMPIPTKDNFFVTRLDHDFGAKWHFMSSYRYYKLTRMTDNQVDIGGALPGDKLGVATAVAPRPQQPWYLVAGLTTNVTSKVTNDFHYSFLRNYWAYASQNAPPQISGLGGAMEPMGESHLDALTPYNVNTQQIRTRFWDGKDNFFRDDVTALKGSHLFQFGGQYQRNFDYHQRSDNGGGINFTPTYQLGDSSGAPNIDMTGLGGGYPGSDTNAKRLAAAVYGMVTDAQVAYTRQGASLALNPPLTHAFDKSTILYYNVYFGDTWHMKPTFTLTYGMGWTLEMPPTEQNGKQTVLVDAADNPVSYSTFIDQRKEAALAGNVYNPELGFALVGNVNFYNKYPYNPFYREFSPRVAAAWNPHFETHSLLGRIFGHDSTVIRGGYGHSYGRINGVDQVLVPLLGVGLIQPVSCTKSLAGSTTDTLPGLGLSASSTCGGATGNTSPTAATSFRIGVDGNNAPIPAAAPTLPQPIYPGFNSTASSAAEGMDPAFRPNVIDSFDLTIQRQLSRKTLVEVGYIGRLIHHEYQPISLNTVPYMMSVGGQQFQSAYAAIEKALGCATSAAQCGSAVPSPTIGTTKTPNPAYATFINNLASGASQPFFQAAVNSAYCTGAFSNGDATPYANCTAAVLDNELGNFESQAVWSMWSDLDSGNFNFPRSMQNTSTGVNDPSSGLPYGSQFSSGVSLNATVGYGNYNGGFVTVSTTDWHGFTFHENFTYSKALGTGAQVQATSEYTVNDAFDLGKNYGVQGFNRKFVYNMYGVWQDPWYKDQRGIIGRLAGGWSIAPIYTAGNGEPLGCYTLTGGIYFGAQEFGSADGSNYGTNAQCVFTSKYNGGVHAHFGITGGTDPYGNSVGTQTAGTTTASEINQFQNPVAVFDQVRAPMLGIDTKNPGVGPILGMPYWNVDMSAQKTFKVWKSATIQLSFIFTNVFNHDVLYDTSLNLASVSTWGVQNAQGNTPRKIEYGIRTSW